MTLNDAESRRTSGELTTNLGLSGLTTSEVAGDLRFTLERLQSALAVADGADPVDVWELRDYLEQAARDAGMQPAGYTVLTDRSRHLARTWLRLRKAPRHVFATS